MSTINLPNGQILSTKIIMKLTNGISTWMRIKFIDLKLITQNYGTLLECTFVLIIQDII